MKMLAEKGAQAAHSARGIDGGSLPSLTSVQAAQAWLEAIGRAVVSGKLKDRSAQAGIRAVEAWMAAERDRVASEDLEELREQLQDVREGLKDGRRMEVVP